MYQIFIKNKNSHLRFIISYKIQIVKYLIRKNHWNHRWKVGDGQNLCWPELVQVGDGWGLECENEELGSLVGAGIIRKSIF